MKLLTNLWRLHEDSTQIIFRKFLVGEPEARICQQPIALLFMNAWFREPKSLWLERKNNRNEKTLFSWKSFWGKSNFGLSSFHK